MRRSAQEKQIQKPRRNSRPRQGPSGQVEGEANLLYKTNFEDYESRIYFQNMLYKKGIVAQLESLGIKQGDTVLFADYEMEFSPEEEEWLQVNNEHF